MAEANVIGSLVDGIADGAALAAAGQPHLVHGPLPGSGHAIRVVIGVLAADDAMLECLGLGFGAVRTHRQGRQAVDEGQLVGRIHLDDGRGHARIVEGADGNLDAAVILVGERRAAVGAEAPAREVGALETLGLAAGPFDPVAGDQWPVEGAERFLAHAAMADRRTPETGDAEAHRPALAAAGEARPRGHRPFPPSEGQTAVS